MPVVIIFLLDTSFLYLESKNAIIAGHKIIQPFHS